MAGFINEIIAKIREHLEVGAYWEAEMCAERLRDWCKAQRERKRIEKLPPIEKKDDADA